jgi:hypothetical protein
MVQGARGGCRDKKKMITQNNNRLPGVSGWIEAFK